MARRSRDVPRRAVAGLRVRTGLLVTALGLFSACASSAAPRAVSKQGASTAKALGAVDQEDRYAIIARTREALTQAEEEVGWFSSALDYLQDVETDVRLGRPVREPPADVVGANESVDLALTRLAAALNRLEVPPEAPGAIDGTLVFGTDIHARRRMLQRAVVDLQRRVDDLHALGDMRSTLRDFHADAAELERRMRSTSRVLAEVVDRTLYSPVLGRVIGEQWFALEIRYLPRMKDVVRAAQDRHDAFASALQSRRTALHSLSSNLLLLLEAEADALAKRKDENQAQQQELTRAAEEATARDRSLKERAAMLEHEAKRLTGVQRELETREGTLQTVRKGLESLEADRARLTEARAAIDTRRCPQGYSCQECSSHPDFLAACGAAYSQNQASVDANGAALVRQREAVRGEQEALASLRERHRTATSRLDEDRKALSRERAALDKQLAKLREEIARLLTDTVHQYFHNLAAGNVADSAALAQLERELGGAL